MEKIKILNIANTKYESIRMAVRSKEDITKIKQNINLEELKIEERKKRVRC